MRIELVAEMSDNRGVLLPETPDLKANIDYRYSRISTAGNATTSSNMIHITAQVSLISSFNIPG
jgi:hypothetical protein